MAESPQAFAGLLRGLRTDARLTQEELAEAAGLSPRSVSDLERGINQTARKETAVLLAGALGLPEAVAELFAAAAPEEARALEGLGRAHIQDSNHDKGLDCLRPSRSTSASAPRPPSASRKPSTAQACRKSPNDPIRAS